MIEIIRALQALYVLSWVVPLVMFAKPAWRKANDVYDRLAAATWYTSFSLMCFPLFWLWQGGGVVESIPHEKLAMWSALYVLGICAAIYLTHTVQRVCAARA